MDLTRRDFLRVAGASSVAGILFAGCAIPERELIKQSPRDMPEDLATGTEDWYATSCNICNERHGVVVRVLEGRAKKIEGNPDHPSNRGKVLPICLSGVHDVYHPDRLLTPTKGGDSITWAQGVDELISKLQTSDPKKTVLITGNEKGLLGHVVRKFVESSGIEHVIHEDMEDTVLRSSVKDIFGQDQIPHFDIENAGSILSIGADFLESWVAPLQYSRAYGEFRNSSDDKDRGKLIHASSRFSMTAANADSWLPVAPGMEGALAMSIAYVLISNGDANEEVADKLTGGRGLAAIADYAPEKIAPSIGMTEGVITAEKIEEIARILTENSPGLVLAGGSAAAQQNGKFNTDAALVLNGLLGNVGKPGGLIFNPTSSIEELSGFTSPSKFSQWQNLVERLESNQIDLVLVHGADPVHTLDSIGFKDALSKAGSVVAFSAVVDETGDIADLILPDQNYLESWNVNVPDPLPGYFVATIQQPVLPPLVDDNQEIIYDNRPFGDLLLSIGQKLGYSSNLPWENMEQLVRDTMLKLHRVNRDRGSIQGSDFESFWTGILQRGGWWDTSSTTDDDWAVPSRFLQQLASQNIPDKLAENENSGVYHLIPFVSVGLGAGSSSYLPWPQSTPDPLTSVVWETWIEVNSREAKRLGFRDGDIVEVKSVGTENSIEVPVYIHPGIPPNAVSIPLGRGHIASGRYAKDFGTNVRKILSTNQDVTGAQAWGETKVTITGTGRRLRLPRMEGGITGMQLEGTEIIQLTTG